MLNPFSYPLFLFAVSLPTFWIAARFGATLRERRHESKEDARKDFSFVISPTLTLLALILSFAFSMAVSRYDQRKNYEEKEANAIGTEYFRANLLPLADAEKVHALIKNYLDLRILYFRSRSEYELRKINAQTAQLQSQMWSAASAPITLLPGPIATFILGGMNDVLNSQGWTQAAWRNRIPVAAWALLITTAIFCNFLIGYNASGRTMLYFLILPIVLSVSLFLIADIDAPRRGIIHVHPQNLQSLAEFLNSQ